MKSTPQLTLAVQLPDDETFGSFYGEGHSVLVEQLKLFIQLHDEDKSLPSSFYLFGIEGAGKSHLLHASCAYAESLGLTSLCLSLADLTQLSVDVLDGLENIDLICLDDVQCISTDNEWQRGIFDLYNRVMEANKRIIISGNVSANDLGVTLPDLLSRLNWGYTEQVKVLDDKEKLETLQYRAQQRGVFLSDDVGKYLLNHFSRDIKSLIQVLDTLDKASIREQRKITIPFIKDVLVEPS